MSDECEVVYVAGQSKVSACIGARLASASIRRLATCGSITSNA